MQVGAAIPLAASSGEHDRCVAVIVSDRILTSCVTGVAPVVRSGPPVRITGRCGARPASFARRPRAQQNNESPEMAATYCLPFTAYVIGFCRTWAPRFDFHNSDPFRRRESAGILRGRR